MEDADVISRDGCYAIAGSRVSLDSVVYAFLDGDSPETIVQSFPALTLEQVYGAITYYLAHRADVDAHLRMEESDFERRRQASRQQNADLYRKLEEKCPGVFVVTRGYKFAALAEELVLIWAASHSEESNRMGTLSLSL